MHVYTGLDELQRFQDDTAKAFANGHVLMSPGGAAAAVGTSRQRMHQLIRDGTVEAWLYYEVRRSLFAPPKQDLAYAYVSMADVFRWALKTGKLPPDADLGGFELSMRKTFDAVKAEV